MELERFVVELERPPGGWSRLRETTASARDAAAAMRADGVPVRFLRSVFVPEDERCFLLYEAPSSLAVRQAVERSAATAMRVAETTRLDTDTGDPTRRKERA